MIHHADTDDCSMPTKANTICDLLWLTFSWPLWYPESSFSHFLDRYFFLSMHVPFFVVSIVFPSFFPA